jgi:hypothetical protein
MWVPIAYSRREQTIIMAWTTSHLTGLKVMDFIMCISMYMANVTRSSLYISQKTILSIAVLSGTHFSNFNQCYSDQSMDVFIFLCKTSPPFHSILWATYSNSKTSLQSNHKSWVSWNIDVLVGDSAFQVACAIVQTAEKQSCDQTQAIKPVSLVTWQLLQSARIANNLKSTVQ